MMERRRSPPPDGGYGWVIVLSAFWVMGLTAAVLKNFGLFFLDIQAHFNVQTSTASWVTSTTIAMFHLAAPAASALTLRFSQRVVIIMGGLLCTSGMLLASLELGLPCLYLTMGMLQDIVGLEDFDSGLGLFMLFRSTGGFISPPLAGLLVDRTGYYNAAFYLSGLCLISSAAFTILVDYFVQKKDAKHLEVREISSTSLNHAFKE